MADPQTATPTTPASPPAAPAATTASQDGSKQETAAKQDQSPAKMPEANARERKQDEPEHLLREVGAKLQEAAVALRPTNGRLAEDAIRLANGAEDVVRLNQRSFQHELAYAVQDVERARGAPLALSDQARAEVSRLAGSAPGLENERLVELLRSTSKTSDQKIVDDIRRASTEVGQGANQATPDILSRIEALEGRSRLAARALEEPTPSGATVNRSQATHPDKQDAQVRADTSANESGSPALGTQSPTAQTIVVQEQGGLVNGVLRAMRQSGPTNTPPWEAGAQPFGDRLASFEQRMASGKDEATLKGAEKSGRAAIDALEGFRAGEGSVILNRINEAAKSDPNGMAGVLSEMREGGRFADLRKQFNTALSDERGASAAYDKAAGALATYGEDRKAVDQVIARRPDAAALSAKFEELDKEIGTAAKDVPSRRDGKSMVDDLAKQVAEMLQKAVDSVKSIFTGRPSDRASSSGPSPSP